jgi:hypothetical protein
MNFFVTSKCRKLGGYPDTYSVADNFGTKIQSQKQTHRVPRVSRRLNYRAVCFHADHFHSNDSKTIGKMENEGKSLGKADGSRTVIAAANHFQCSKRQRLSLIVYVESQQTAEIFDIFRCPIFLQCINFSLMYLKVKERRFSYFKKS